MKVVKGTPKHLSRTGQLDSFTYLMINLDFICNYHCPKCFNIYEEKPKVPSETFLTLDEKIRLIHQAKEMGGKVVVFAGEGEPTIHPNIRELVTATNSLAMIPIVYSNGSALTEEILEFYRRNNTVLVISLDSLINERHDFLTGTKGKLPAVLSNIDRLRQIYRGTIFRQAGLTVLSVAINTTVSGINHDEVPRIKEFCGEDIYFICNPLARLGNAVVNWDNLMHGENVVDYMELIRSMSESGGPLTLGNDGLCGYSRWGISVNPCGDYMTCAYTSLTDSLLGNSRQKSLKDAFEYKQGIESMHYAKCGVAPCLVRAQSFQKYILRLKLVAK
jgi:MoaA/NifB/PqqE/SkfB family radical SAM enzyme